MTKKEEIHLFVIWSNAFRQKDIIINDIKNNFEIIQIFKIYWQKKEFYCNLKAFYSHSQYHLSAKEYKKLLKRKIKHCGDKPFILVVVKDKNPNYLKRETSSGLKSVNANIFDKKNLYREWTGGGHKIHATDTTKETNKDLTLLLGLNIADFTKKYEKADNTEIKNIKNNCLGVGGFNSISEYFYLLNSSIEYVVLRNFDNLPESYYEEMHNDIDLLVENLNYIVYLTNAEPIFPNLSFRVHFSVKIDGKNIPFDFRYVGDNYYDKIWEKNVLDKRIYRKDCFFVPDDRTYFYSLLYHASIHKQNISIDYVIRLIKLAQIIKLDIDLNSLYDLKSIREVLFEYLENNNYKWVIPDDKSVYFNAQFINDETFINKKNNIISESISFDRHNDKIYKSRIIFEYPNRITKKATNPIAENENKFLKKLENENYFPNTFSFENSENESAVKLEYINGNNIEELGKNYFLNYTASNTIKLIKNLLQILIILNKNDIIHRDIRPNNIIINKHLPILIDFGWAKYRDENSILPFGLGGKYRFKDDKFSDSYSIGKIIFQYMSKGSLLLKLFSRKLMHITDEDYISSVKTENKLLKCEEYLNRIIYFVHIEKYIWNILYFIKKKLVKILIN